MADPAATPTPTPVPTTAATAAPTAAPAATETPVDEFASAFAELTEQPVATLAPSPTPTPVPTETPAPTATPVPTETPAPTAAPVDSSVARELAALREAVSPTPAPTTAPELPLYSAEEQTALEHHRKEWSEVAAGEALVRRAEYRELVSFIFGQIGPQLRALSESNQTVHTRTQYTAIKDLVSDYDEVRDPTLAWVDTQPDYLKDAFSAVAQKGSPEQVADLIARFKKETNWQGKQAPAATLAPTAAPVATPAPTATPVASAAVQAAAALLRPVTTGRTEPAAPADPNDFDAAFKEFAAAK